MLLVGNRFSKEGTSTSKKNQKRKLPPHSEMPSAEKMISFVRHRQWQSLCRHLSLYPADAKTVFVVNEGGVLASRLAIHEACRHQAPVVAVEALINAFPESVQCRDSRFSFYPIHFACRYGGSPSVVEYLLRICPDSRKKADRHGITPEGLVERSSYTNKMEILDVFAQSSEKFQKEAPILPTVMEDELQNSIELEKQQSLPDQMLRVIDCW